MNPTKDIIIFSTADWDNPLWTNKQHTAMALANKGFRILYVESLGLRQPGINKTDLARIMRRLKKGISAPRRVKENIWVTSPLVIPFHQNFFLRMINNWLLIKKINSLRKILNFSHPIIWTYNPLVQRIAEKLNPELLIYHCVDDITTAPLMPSNIIRKSEKLLIGLADIVFTSSPKLQKYCSLLRPDNTYYFPNVADFRHFSKSRDAGPLPDDIAKIPHPRIGFIGAISGYKLDFALIKHIATTRNNWHWVLIGSVGEGDPKTSIKKLGMPNIHFLGLKDYKVLPDYLRGIDIAAIPYDINAYTTSVFPMKFFEYLAAGIPVVTTKLPALEDFKEACIIADSQKSFISAIEDILKGKMPNKESCLNLARKNTWELRTTQMLGLISNKWKAKYNEDRNNS